MASGKLNKKFMRLAIKVARKNILDMSGGPFGACIVKNGKALAVSRNTVLISHASAHAEINAIELASSKIKHFDLSGCQIYSTTEPCPMCFSAIHWARIESIIYGTTIADAKKIGFNELKISCRQMKTQGRSKVKITSGFLLKDCQKLLNDWHRQENKKLY